MRTQWIFSLLFSVSAAAAPVDFNAYFRAGTGSNLKGGMQECFNNSGSQGNEFRLGNECGIYGEATFSTDFSKKINSSLLHSKFFLTFAYAYDNKKDWETTTNNWVLRQAYVELGLPEQVSGIFWVGKRFYRWGDVSSLDFFPISMSGPGGGWGDYRLTNGVFHLGVIQNSESKEISGSGAAISTENKTAAKSTFHARLENFEWWLGNKLSVWGTLGHSAATKSTPPPATDYKSSTGSMIALKNNVSLGPVSNETGLAYGHGVMSSMSSEGELVRDCSNLTLSACTVERSKRFRFWNAVNLEKPTWAAQATLAFDEYDRGTAQDSGLRWLSLGFQPVYYYTDFIHWISGIGLSNVVDESDGSGTRTLTRVTTGLQLSPGKGYYTRPVVRALYTHNFWNSANRTRFASSSAQYNRDEAQNLVIQTEIWF